MTNMVTRCPQCSTSFRITPTQIQKARGAVRCGSCLHIFKAQEHIVQELRPKPAGSSHTTPKKIASKKPVTPKPQQETFDIPVEPKTQRQVSQKASKPRTAVAEKSTTHQKAKTTSKTPSANPKPTPKVEQLEKQARTLNFDQSQIDVESRNIDDDMLISDDIENDQRDASDDSDSDSFYIEPARKSQSLFEGKETALAEDFTDTSDESWADELLEDTPSSNQVIDKQVIADAPMDKKSPTRKMKEAVSTPAKSDAITAETQAPSNPHMQAQRDHEELYGEKLNAFDSERSGFILNIDPEPVEMTMADSTPWYQRSRWGSLSVIAIILLISQIAYLQFDQLSRIQPYRSYYHVACSILDCSLPTLIDTHMVQAHNLVVRNHPEQQNALIVDAIIINKAPFSQPFPVLALEFTDIKSRPVSSRQFSPSEYLHGELSGTVIMPQNQPIHINLELVDPGENAVNYRIYTP